ncbi:class III lanthipeptide [Nonomuraea antri]|nr:class III lanthipeptide [Nonomuraea antri]
MELANILELQKLESAPEYDELPGSGASTITC